MCGKEWEIDQEGNEDLSQWGSNPRPLMVGASGLDVLRMIPTTLHCFSTPLSRHTHTHTLTLHTPAHAYTHSYTAYTLPQRTLNSR